MNASFLNKKIPLPSFIESLGGFDKIFFSILSIVITPMILGLLLSITYGASAFGDIHGGLVIQGLQGIVLVGSYFGEIFFLPILALISIVRAITYLPTSIKNRRPHNVLMLHLGWIVSFFLLLGLLTLFSRLFPVLPWAATIKS
jgi:hypothetical protein